MFYRYFLIVLFIFSFVSTGYANESSDSEGLRRFANFVTLNNMGVRFEPEHDFESKLIKRMSPDLPPKNDSLQVPLDEEDLEDGERVSVHAFKIINKTTAPVDIFFTFIDKGAENGLEVNLNIGLPQNAVDFESEVLPTTAYELIGVPEVSQIMKGFGEILSARGYDIINKQGAAETSPLMRFNDISEGHISLFFKLKSSLTSDQIIEFIKASAAKNFRPEPKPISVEREKMLVFLSSGLLDQINNERNDKDADHLMQMPFNTVMHFKRLIEEDPFLSVIFPDEQMQYDLAEALSRGINSSLKPPIEDVVIDFEEKMIAEGRLRESGILARMNNAPLVTQAQRALVDEDGAKLLSLSFKQVLEPLGYGPLRFTGVPIENHDDLKAAMLGAPNRINNSGMWFWPFTSFSSTPDQTKVAMSFDKRAFTQAPGSESKIIVAKINEQHASAYYVVDFSGDYEIPVTASNVKFITQDLVRARVIYGSSQQRLEDSNQTYYEDYWFISDDGQEKYNLRSELVGQNVVNVRGYGLDVYIIESRIQGASESTYKVIKFNPVTREQKVLIADLDVQSGKGLFQGVVDLPNRDVWSLGENRLYVKFNIFDNSLQSWQPRSLHVLNDEAVISEQHISGVLISGTNDYKVRFENNVLGVEDRRGQVVNYPGREMRYVSLNAMTGGFIAVEANMENYRHFILDLEGNYQRVLTDRLINADYSDGSFIGFSNKNFRSTGEITLHRYTYNPYNLDAYSQIRQERFEGDRVFPVVSCQGLLE